MRKLLLVVPFLSGLIIPYFVQGVFNGYAWVNESSIGPAQTGLAFLTLIGVFALWVVIESEVCK